MDIWLVVLLFSVGAVLLFTVGLSLTLIFKGHHIDSEIATNRHMRARGITCVAADALGEHSPEASDGMCDAHDCASCNGSPVRSGDSPR